MHNNPDTIRKAKGHIRKYTLCCVLFFACVSLAVCLFYETITSSTSVFLLTLVAIGWISRSVRIIFHRKCIASVLYDELDADTFFAMVYQGKLFSPSAAMQLCAEYFCGHCQNVISLCRKKLADPKSAKKFRFLYLSWLANVYFDIGDEEKLWEVCEQYETALAKEIPRKQAVWRKRYQRMAIYMLYLKRDINACLEWMNKPAKTPLAQQMRTFYRARLALLQGNPEEARAYYEALAQTVPQLNYGKLAAQILGKMATQEDEQTVPKLTEMVEVTDKASVVTEGSSWRFTLCKIACIVLLVFGLIAFLRSAILEQEYKKELAAYREQVRVLVEQDYDDVTVLDSFSLESGDAIIDELFICQTDTQVLIGSTFVYEDNTALHYEIKIEIPLEVFSEDRSPLQFCSFWALFSDDQINCCFYGTKKDVPKDSCYESSFEVNGRTVYFVVTEIIPTNHMER